MKKTGRWLLYALPLAALFAALPSHALYKVVGPDGKVTYTDTPPPPSPGTKVIQLGNNANVIPDTGLPLELRQASQRFPVTLYSLKVCEPCDQGRAMLRQRGVPFTERLIISVDDAEALSKLSGGRDAPTLTIGGQVLRGFAADVWGNYLDTAGYPRESRLPANYQYPAATPLTEAPAPPLPLPRPTAPAPNEPQLPPSTSGIRF